MLFPQRLKQLRTDFKLTQEQLGKKINVTKVSVSGYENGNRMPDTETLQKIADLFGVSTDYLLGRSDHPVSFDEHSLTLTGDKKRPPYKKQGTLISTQMAGRGIKPQDIARELDISLEEFKQITLGNVAVTEQQAEVLSKLLGTRKEIYLPDKEAAPFDPVAEIQKVFEQYQITDVGFFDIEKWKKMTPDEVELLKRTYEMITRDK